MILMRHGQTVFNVVYGKTRKDPGIRDPELTADGRLQVTQAADRLRHLTVHRVIASPYRRTLETADIITEALDIPLFIDPSVGERAVFTCDIGTPRSALAERWPDLTLDHLEEDWWPALEESEAALDQRCQQFRTRIAGDGAWSGTLVITHWGVIRALTGHRVQNADLVRFDPTAPHPGGGAVVPETDP